MISHKHAFTVQEDEKGSRIDTFLSKKTGITRSHIKRLIEDGHVNVKSSPVKYAYKIKTGDVINLQEVNKKDVYLNPEPIPINILYKDKHLVIVDKPPGMVMYPAAGHQSNTLLNAITYRVKNLTTIGAPLRPGVVHRIDKETSGLIVIALNDNSYYDLISQFKNRAIERKYLAIVYGRLREDKGEISRPIGRSTSDRKKMSTRTYRGKPAVTKWHLIEQYTSASLVGVTILTGRTHQIRVHFSSIGHPVLGDRTYGRKTRVELRRNEVIHVPRQMLHAETLGFIHPETRRHLKFHSPIPKDMNKVIKLLKAQNRQHNNTQ